MKYLFLYPLLFMALTHGIFAEDCESGRLKASVIEEQSGLATRYIKQAREAVGRIVDRNKPTAVAKEQITDGSFSKLDLQKLRERSLSEKIYDGIKRALVMGSIIVTSPITISAIGTFAVMIRMDSKGNVFYWAERVGLDGESIHVLKMRSMRDKSDPRRIEFEKQLGEGAGTVKNDPRTAGRWAELARKLKIDELPQLFYNVLLKNNMNLIGHRPLDSKEIDLFVNSEMAKDPAFNSLIVELRALMKPGLADAAQATLPHSGNANTPEGQQKRIEKILTELNAYQQRRSGTVAQQAYKDLQTLFLVFAAIASGRGGS